MVAQSFLSDHRGSRGRTTIVRSHPTARVESPTGGYAAKMTSRGLLVLGAVIIAGCDTSSSSGDGSGAICPAAAPLDCGNGKCCPSSSPYFCPNDGAPACATNPSAAPSECAGYFLCGGSSGSSGGTSGPCAHWSCGGSSQCASVLGATSGVQCQFAPGQTCQQWCQQYVPGNCTCQ
jgi:hypothetical protein